MKGKNKREKIRKSGDKLVDMYSIVLNYVTSIKEQLGKDKGEMWWTGRGKRFIKQHLGKNKLGEIGKEVAKFNGLEDWQLYTLHTYRRSGATAAADAGMSIIFNFKFLKYFLIL